MSVPLVFAVMKKEKNSKHILIEKHVKLKESKGPDAATSILQSAESPMFVEPTLSASDVASGAVSRMSDFFKRKLKENEAMRQSTYGL